MVFNLNQVWTWPTKWQWQKWYNLVARNTMASTRSQGFCPSLLAKVNIKNIIFLYWPLGGGVLWAQYIPTNAIYGIMAIWYFNCLAEYQEKRTHFNWNKITFFTSKMWRKILLYPFKKLGRSLGSSRKSDSYYHIFLDAVLGTLNFSFPSWSLRKEYPFLFLTSKVENLFLNFFFSSQSWRTVFQFSLFLLERGEFFFFKILFLLLKLEKRISISLSLLKSRESVFKFLFLFSKLENSISNFSVSSRKWWIYFHFLFLLLKLEKRIFLSLSLLESWESFFKFLFLFSKLGKGFSNFSFSSRNWRK